jgi:dephospho-CoA kinase
VIIGLTGGIACGKSTVSQILQNKGCIIVDADQIAREVVAPGEQGLAEIVDQFGTGVLFADGSLDRKALGRIVFANPDARLKLNAILHPLIRLRIEERTKAALAQDPPHVVLDIPLLLESKQGYPIEVIVVVYIPEHLQLARLMDRDGISQKEALERIHSQMSIEQKAALADYVIDNGGSREETKQQVDTLFLQLAKRQE